LGGRERDMWEDWWWKAGREERTFEEVALLDAELAYAGAEPEEGKAEDGAEQCHGGRSIGRIALSLLKREKVIVTGESSRQVESEAVG